MVPATMQETIEVGRKIFEETGFPGLHWIDGGLDYGHQAFHARQRLALPWWTSAPPSTRRKPSKS